MRRLLAAGVRVAVVGVRVVPMGVGQRLVGVEVVVAVQKKFGIRIGNQETSRQVFQSIRTLAAYVEANR